MENQTQHSKKKSAYKTYHPAARITKEEKWDYYHAILDDIKEHIPDIFLKNKGKANLWESQHLIHIARYAE